MPGPGALNLDDHMVQPWCTMCPPSSSICGRYALQSSRLQCLVRERRCHTETTRRTRAQTGWAQGLWLEFLVWRTRPRLWDSHGANKFGTEVSPRDPGKTRARHSEPKGFRRRRSGQALPLLTSEAFSPKLPKPQSQRRAKPRCVDLSQGTSAHQGRRLAKTYNHQKGSYPRAFPRVNA